MNGVFLAVRIMRASRLYGPAALLLVPVFAALFLYDCARAAFRAVLRSRG